MEQSHILAFIKSTRNVFETMLQLSVEVGTPVLSTVPDSSFDVSAIIGMSGDLDGSVVLSFRRETAMRLVSIFCGTEVADDAEDLIDAVGELANMITGGAKAQLDGKKVTISCPSVVIGAQHSVHGSKDLVRMSIPCSYDCGEFTVEVAVRPSSASSQDQTVISSAEAA